MKGIKIIPHSTLKNDKIKEIVRGLHVPVKYTDRYNFKATAHFNDELRAIPIKKALNPKAVKRALSPMVDSDLLIYQNNNIYEIEITAKSVEFRLLSEDLENTKKTYAKYIDNLKFDKVEKEYPIDIVPEMDIVEMDIKEHYMFSLKTLSNGLEPLRYILDLKRQLKPGEKFIYQVVMLPIEGEWKSSYGEAYRKYKEGKMPQKFSITPKAVAKVGGDIAVGITIEGLSVIEEILFGIGNSELSKIDLTEDNVAHLRRDKGLSRATLNKVGEVGYEVAIRGIIYAKSESRRDFIGNQFKNCFTCLDGDNKLVGKTLKKSKYNINRVKYREIRSHTAISSKNILSGEEVANLLYLPQITLQQRFNVERLDFREVDLVPELREGIIPIGEVYGAEGVNAYWSTIKDVITLSKVFVGVKGSGKSKYLENYVYYAHKSKDCIVYFDYIENNQNAIEVSKHIPKEDIITLDLSKGFTFDYPELDTSNIPKNDEYNRTLKRFASEFSKLIESFINTINTDDTAGLTGNMRNILVSACSFTFLVGDTALYNIYKILSNHTYRGEVIRKVKEMNIYAEDDFRFNTLNSLDVVEVNSKTKKEKIVGTNNKADRVLDRFNALLRDSRTEEMLLGIDRNVVNFVDMFEQNKLILVLMPEEYFSDDELKDIVVTYFLSRMWLSALKRGALIPDRDKRKVVHIILDEIHKLKHSTNLMVKNIAEDRKFRTTYVYTCQYLKQFGNLWNAVKGSGSHFMLLSGTEKENFTMLKEEIGNEFELEELINLPPRTSLNLIRYNGQNITSFITSLPTPLDVYFKRLNRKESKYTTNTVEELTEANNDTVEVCIEEVKPKEAVIVGKTQKIKEKSKKFIKKVKKLYHTSK